MFFFVCSMLCHAVLFVLSSFAVILPRKRGLVALLSLFSWCPVTVIVLRLFLTVLLVCLQCVIVVFLAHTHLLFKIFVDAPLISMVNVIFQTKFLNVVCDHINNTIGNNKIVIPSRYSMITEHRPTHCTVSVL